MMFLTFTDVTEIVDETVEEEECKTIEEEMCSQPAPQFGEKCQDVEVSTVQNLVRASSTRIRSILGYFRVQVPENL